MAIVMAKKNEIIIANQNTGKTIGKLPKFEAETIAGVHKSIYPRDALILFFTIWT